MKITITQHEIEEAVRKHIHDLVAIKDGNEITMEFSATRGADGLTAFIDISPSAVEKIAAPVEQTPAPTPTRVTRKAVEAAPAVTLSPEGEAAKVEVEEPARPAGSKSLFGKTPTTVVNDDVEAVFDTPTEPAADGVEEVEGSQPLKRSIFANLGRPTNDAEAAA